MDPDLLIFLELGTIPLLILVWQWEYRRRHISELDRKLFHWSEKDPFTVRDLLAGGLLTLGMTGSGKSSSSGWQIGQALVRDSGSYGLILAAKPEDLPTWRKIFEKTGQSQRLLIFDCERSKLRFNFLNEVSQRGGGTRDITECITTIGETLRSGERRGDSENGSFFAMQEERLIHHAVEILRAARTDVTASHLHQFIVGAALSPDQLIHPEWQKEFHNQCLAKAHAIPHPPLQQHDLQLATDYWCGEFPSMNDRTRSSILAGVFSVLFVFNSGMVQERVSSTTNFTFDDLKRKRQWLLVNTPPCAMGSNGLFIGTGFKYLQQRFVLSQAARKGDPVHVCWVDEAGQWTNKFDAEYISQSRSHRGCLVYLAQSIHSFHGAAKGENGKHQTLALLGNFGHRIIHSLGDVETASWASSTLGEMPQTHVGGSMHRGGSVFDEIVSGGHFTGSFGTEYRPVLQPTEFMNGMRSGGPLNHFLCDAIVIRPGRRFSNGQNWIRKSFSQR